MKHLLITLFWAALVSPLAAQHPAAPCHDACPPKVCVSEPTTKKVTRVVYESKCIDYCLPKCSLLGGCADCGKPRTKHILVKKVITEECPATKCVVQIAPACTTAAPATAPADKVGSPLPKSKE